MVFKIILFCVCFGACVETGMTAKYLVVRIAAWALALIWVFVVFSLLKEML